MDGRLAYQKSRCLHFLFKGYGLFVRVVTSWRRMFLFEVPVLRSAGISFETWDHHLIELDDLQLLRMCLLDLALIFDLYTLRYTSTLIPL